MQGSYLALFVYKWRPEKKTTLKEYDLNGIRPWTKNTYKEDNLKGILPPIYVKKLRVHSGHRLLTKSENYIKNIF